MQVRQNLWERACSRRGRHIQHLHCLGHRFREQARSHNGPRYRHRRIDPLCTSIHANNAINILLHLSHHPPQ
ncbi:hypothetical protein CCX46_18355 [Pseudomonas sp. RU47]|nr:hypothetical protein CCX46_18355 [Pseudomonas sp. RU47]